jgi:hypothetical protein
MGHAFFSLREKYASEAKGDEGLIGLIGRIAEALTCLANVSASDTSRLSSPEGSGMSWLTCLTSVRLSSPEGRGMCVCSRLEAMSRIAVIPPFRGIERPSEPGEGGRTVGD